MPRLALIRPVSASIVRCELTHLARQPIDLERARIQHHAYAAALAQAGCTVRTLAALDDQPDAVFVEDTAVVLDEVAVITNPGAASRRAEVDSVAAALAALRPLVRIHPPATLDGGDVLRVGRTLFVGRTPRTNAAGIAALAAVAGRRGYEVVPVAVEGCLHLKSGVGKVAPRTLLINRAWIDAAPFDGLELIGVDAAEPMAANALRLGERLIYPEAFPRTAEALGARGIALLTVAADELGKAEGGVTCCSLVFEA